MVLCDLGVVGGDIVEVSLLVDVVDSGVDSVVLLDEVNNRGSSIMDKRFRNEFERLVV